MRHILPHGKIDFLIEDEYVVNQLVADLKYANLSSYLISGYHGVGKTSFVNDVTELSDEFIIVHINLAKYDNYSIL
jgi:hypothetical protein